MPRRKRRFTVPKLQLASHVKQDIFVVLIFAIAFINILAMFDLAGTFGNSINNFWQMIFGFGWWIWPFVMILIGYLIINIEKLEISATKWTGLLIFELTFSGLLHLFVRVQDFNMAKQGEGGGILGYLVAMPLENIAGFWGALIILFALLLISILLFFESSFSEIWEKIHLPNFNLFKKSQNENYDYEETDDVGFEQKEIETDDSEDHDNNEIDNFEDSEEKTKQKATKS